MKWDGAGMVSRINQHWSIVGLTFLILVFSGTNAAQRAHAQCQYDVTIIQAPDCPPFGAQPTLGRGINQAGDVVGQYNVCVEGPSEAFLWEGGPDLITLARPPGVGGAGAWDVNDAGQIVGQMTVSGVGTRAFLYEHGEFIDLGTLPGGTFSAARAINDRTQIVGKWGNGIVGPGLVAFLWEDGLMIDLTLDLGTPLSEARGINSKGEITGWMGSSLISDARAFMWSGGVVTELPAIPGALTSEGEAINSLGQVVGSGKTQDADTAQITRHAFVWTRLEGTDIGTLPGLIISAATDVNETGRVVGRSWSSRENPNISRAFVWQNGVMTDLNDLIPFDSDVLLKVATAINDSGQITGWGSIGGPAGEVVAFLLTPAAFPIGDLNADCRVSAFDLALLLGSWGPCGGCAPDLNGDDVVNAADLAILLGNWG